MHQKGVSGFSLARPFVFPCTDLYPREPLPDGLQGAVAVVVHPPSAEAGLGDEDADAGGHTRRVAELQMQAPVIEERGTDDALRDIVGETHTAVGHDELHGPVEWGGVEGEEQRGDDDCHEAELVQRVDDQHQRRQESGIGEGREDALRKGLGGHGFHESRNQRTQSVEGEEGEERHGQDAAPQAAVVGTVGKPFRPASHHAEDEERGRLEEAAVLPGPGQTENLSLPEISFQCLPEVALRERYHDRLPVVSVTEGQDGCLAVYPCRITHLQPFQWLQHQHGGEHQQVARLHPADDE